MSEKTTSAFSSEQETVISFLHTLIHQRNIKTEIELRAALDEVKSFGPNLTEDDLEAIFDHMVVIIGVLMDTGIVIQDKDHEPWLSAASANIQWLRWNAYKQYLTQSGRSPAVISSLSESLDSILDHLGNPFQAHSWQSRGLVIGSVQSGKTGTYIGLINKAIDAGYRYVVLLTGHTESLRQQTQERIDEGTIGRDSRFMGNGKLSNKTIGVGKYLAPQHGSNIFGMTTAVSDFKVANVAAVNFAPGADVTVIFATKKNKSTLKNVTDWLTTLAHDHGQIPGPMLLIDDESDYYSVNTRSADKDPAAINKGIRTLLKLFKRNSYVGFTATPFANIFIDHKIDDDLFPKDFIYALESPSNYVGPDQIFSTSIEPGSPEERTVLTLDDAEEIFPLKHKKELEVAELPESLLEAIRVFMLTNTIRDLRKQENFDRSMLVNVSRFVKVQNEVFELVKEVVASYKHAIDLHSMAFKKGNANSTMSLFKETFEKHFEFTEFAWPVVLEGLNKSVSPIKVTVSNSKTDKALIDDGLHNSMPNRVIAVGGDLLSRGLTLEGLSTSYFYRNAGAYDTLMQMGRWFGYREGYRDLTRIWISDDMATAFAHVADTLQDLRLEIAKMRQNHMTPAEFGLAIMNHPDSLLITARNKMLTAKFGQKKTISLRGRSLESPKLSKDEEVTLKNFEATEQIVEELTSKYGIAKPFEASSAQGWSDIDKSYVADFIKVFTAHTSDPHFEGEALSKYIRYTAAVDLQTWDVAFIGGNTKQSRDLKGLKLHLPERALKSGTDNSWLVSAKSRRLAGVGDVGITLKKELRDKLKKQYIEDFEGKRNVPDKIYVDELPRPSLLIYVLSPKQPNVNAKEVFPEIPVVGAKISIPPGPAGASNNDVDNDGVTYVLTKSAVENWTQNFSDDLTGEFEEGEVDEA
ncbi:Z1 domain-containing protein [Aurantimicrobium minutum]|uniref:Z1 domain-containing protein n=1 Tax=Aurantimicrobium minutum TaxID=708131 RepID=UPI0024755084|nr:Z1 domain-containing protein [Aurantimicrobium minutum]MDH6536929.1 hypothetical protein [Aurantimicrobium minutum]